MMMSFNTILVPIPLLLLGLLIIISIYILLILFILRLIVHIVDTIISKSVCLSVSINFTFIVGLFSVLIILDRGGFTSIFVSVVQAICKLIVVILTVISAVFHLSDMGLINISNIFEILGGRGGIRSKISYYVSLSDPLSIWNHSGREGSRRGSSNPSSSSSNGANSSGGRSRGYNAGSSSNGAGGSSGGRIDVTRTN